MAFLGCVVFKTFFRNEYLNSCLGNEYSILGFGDIIVPAIMTALCVKLDMLFRVRRIFKQYGKVIFAGNLGPEAGR